MNFGDNLSTAKIIRTENELEIKVISGMKARLLNLAVLLIYFSLFFTLTLIFLLLADTFFAESNAAIFFPMLSLFFFPFISHKLGFGNIQDANSPGFLIHKNQEKIIGKTDESTFISMPKPYFIDIFVLPIEKNRIRVVLENKGVKIGHYTLKNGEDLMTLIDGFTELLDLELYENNKLSNSEVLSFKSKNSAIEPHSGLWIRTPNNKLVISSLPNTSHWIELDLAQQILKNKNKQFELKEIEKIVIQKDGFKKMKLDIVTKKGKTKTIFKHQVSEVTMIRDKKRLVEALQNQAILQGVEIEVENKIKRLL